MPSHRRDISKMIDERPDEGLFRVHRDTFVDLDISYRHRGAVIESASASSKRQFSYPFHRRSRSGSQTYTYDGIWKLQAEYGVDGDHIGTIHPN
jgi:hypothetical protein